MNILSQVLSLLSYDQRIKILKLQVLVIVMALFEMIAIVLIGPFMALASDINFVIENDAVRYFYQVVGVESNAAFLMYYGVFMLLIILMSTIIASLTTWRLSIYAQMVGAEFSERLFCYYLSRKWEFHAQTNSSVLVTSISTEVTRLTTAVMFPIVQLMARLIVVLFIVAAVFYMNPVVAFQGVGFLALAYLLIYRFVKVRLSKNGKIVSVTSEKRYRILSEGFRGVRDIIISGRAVFFSNSLSKVAKEFAIAFGNILALSLLPRYLMEFLIFTMIIGLMLIVSYNHPGDLQSIIPLLAIYGVAGLKLLPSFQQIYAYIAQINANVASLYAVADDLRNAMNIKEELSRIYDNSINITDYTFDESYIVFDKLSFAFKGEPENVVHDINVTISKHEYIAIVGKSGSGKSTLLELLIGLYDPLSGTIKIKGLSPNKESQRASCKIGYVPQKVFISDSSLLENVAFGQSLNEIDFVRFEKVINQAKVNEFIDGLKDREMTVLGENGVRLSGGQVQRIALARALYFEPEILVLDEATSALDMQNEQDIMKALEELRKEVTIIMVAHRLSTIKNCDRILVMEKGRIVESGTYNELINMRGTFFDISKGNT